jgi:hypothetical protein
VSAKRTSSWFKEAGAEQQLIYSFSGNYFPWVTQVEDTTTSQTDYSICNSDMSWKDAGTYYYVKLKKVQPDMEFMSSAGIYVSVKGEYSLIHPIYWACIWIIKNLLHAPNHYSTLHNLSFLHKQHLG